uniref:Major facilitator superfamily (MFS) profile domain-containing protein n=1 Tax=Anopheles christyi TaxID=43041 RepID=A0A182JY07_9DIPT
MTVSAVPAQQSREETRWTFWLITAGISTTFGAAVPTGYNIGVINAPANFIKSWCNETIFETYGTVFSEGSLETFWSAVVSIFLIGGVIGSLGGAWVADRLGRKRSFLLCGFLLFVGGVCFQFCQTLNSVELLMIGRIVVGLAAGLTTSTVPMYLTELAPLGLRGALGVFCSMGVTGGVVVGQVISLEEIFGTEEHWQFALSFYVILVVIFFVPYPWLPESPKYLFVIRRRQDEAVNELKRVAGKKVRDEYVREQIDAMRRECTPENDEESCGDGHSTAAKPKERSILSVLRDPALLLPLILVCALQGGQQLSGINAVFFYSVSIFESVGLSSTDAKFANLGAGCLNLFVAFFSPILMAKFNRRFLALTSCAMCALFLFCLTFIVFFIDDVEWFSYASIVAILLYILFYQIGLGPIPYFIGSELFEVGPRPAAMAMGSLASWGCNFIVAMLFTTLQSAWGAFVFLPFAFSCVALTLLLRMYLPETRGKHISQIVPLVAKGFSSKPLESGWTLRLVGLGAITSLGASIPVGYNLGVINAPSEYIKHWSNETIYRKYNVQLSDASLRAIIASIISIALIGGVIGSLQGAYLADRYGRKKTFLCCALLLSAGALCFLFCRAASSVELLLLGRLLVGLASGLTTGVIPMYLAEVSPIKLRGAMGVLCPLGLTTGVVVAQVTSLEQVLGTDEHWHYALGCFAVLNLFCYAFYFWIPESPKYLYSVKGDQAGSLRAIRKLFGRHTIGDDYIKLQMECANAQHSPSINGQTAQEDGQPQANRSLWSVIRDPTLTLPLVLVCALQGGQQLSGINAVFFYSVSIFESVGFSSKAAKFANLGVGCLNLFVSLFGPMLMARFNRRALCLLSCSSCAIILFILTLSIHFIEMIEWFSYICIGTILMYIIFYQFGLGPIPFFIGSELFDLGPRPTAMALGSLSSWGCNFIVGMAFPTLQNIWGAFVFLPFSITCVLLTVLIKLYLPETRGKEVTDVAQKVAHAERGQLTTTTEQGTWHRNSYTAVKPLYAVLFKNVLNCTDHTSVLVLIADRYFRLGLGLKMST